MVQKKMSFKDISYLQLWWPICLTEWNHLCKCGRGHYEGPLNEINSNLDKWFKRKFYFKIFLIYSCGGIFARWSRAICAIWVEGIMRNISVELF